ncbi:MAG: phage portal protein [Steroidobacteraceae bacterium]|nr:phage portal protein [Steroidobacteraceae bacterium]
MTLLGGLLRVSERAIRDEDLWGRWQRGDDVDDGMSLAGVRVRRETAMQLSAVWACVSLISDTISTLPLDTFIRRDGVRTPFRPRPRWVTEPNPEQERPQWISQQLVSLLLDGNAYVYTPRSRSGEVLEAWNVPPWMVTPRRVRRGAVVYDLADPELGVVTLDRSEMFHVPGMSWPGEIRGMAPLEAARHMLGAGLASQEFAERFFGQGFHAAGVVEYPGDLSVEQARQLKQDFGRMNSGLRKAHLPAVLTNGASWKQVTVTPEQAQFLESRRFTVSEIARFFRVPPHLIGDVEKSTSWGTGIEQQGIGFVVHTLMPWLERLEAAYSRHLLLFDEAFVKFNVNGLMRGDFKTRTEGYAAGLGWGWLCADEVRALEDLPPLPDGQGQTFLVPTTHRPADAPWDGGQQASTDDRGPR